MSVVSRVMSNQLQKLAWMVSLALLLVNPPVLAEDHQKPKSKISQLSDIEQPATTIQQWLAQSVISVTGVNFQTTDKGIEVILQTSQSEQLQLTNQSEGNNFIINIPNAQLRLPSGETLFRQQNPTAGINEITVSNLDANTIRVTVIGETDAPQVQLFDAEQGLVFEILSTVSTAQTPQTQPTPPAQNETAEVVPQEEFDTIELVVTATRTAEDPLDIPRSVRVINREQIQEQAAITNSVADMISRFVPGLGPANRSNRANAQSLRGRNFSVLIDGVPQRSNRSPNVQLEYIDPDNIERIEVVSGPTSIYGAEATGGVINIITRRPSDQTLVSTFEFGLKDIAIGEFQGDSIGYDLRYGISGQQGIMDYVVSFGRGTTGNFYDAQGNLIPTDNRTIDNTETINILTKFGFALGEQQRLDLNFLYNDNSRDLKNIPVVNPEPGGNTLAIRRPIEFASGSTRPRIRSLTTSLNYTHDNLFLNSQVGLKTYYRNSFNSTVPSDSREDGFFDAIVSSRSSEEALGGQLQINTPLFSGANLTWGADFEFQRNGASITEEADPQDFDQRRVFRTVNEYDNIAPEYNINNLGLFGQLRWDLTERFLVSGGVRHDRFNFKVDDYVAFYDEDFNRFFDPGFNLAQASIEGGERTFNSTVFNIGTVYRLTPELSAFANFSQGFSVPRFLNFLGFPPPGFTIDGAFADLQPQKVNQYEVGIRGRFDAVQFSLAGFYNSSELGARLVPDERGITTLQRAPERVYGVEASLDWQPSDRWQLGSVVSWNEGESDPRNTGDFQPLDSFNIQPLKLTAYVQHRTLPGWTNRFQFLYVGDRNRAFEATDFRGRPIDPAPIESYFVVDYISSIRLGTGTLQLGVQNLLNNQYSSVFSQRLPGTINNFAESGRTLSATYRVSW